jgi:hypothetical protein
LCFVRFVWVFMFVTYRDKEVVGVFVRFFVRRFVRASRFEISTTTYAL